MRRFLAHVMLPLEGSSCPMRIRNKVVLPMPLGPTSASRAPLATEKETPEKISSAPKDLEREETVIRDIVKGNQELVTPALAPGASVCNCAPNYKAGRVGPRKSFVSL